ncbi:arylamine N-acetyltransferase, liver isozyme-like [Styela clava]
MDLKRFLDRIKYAGPTKPLGIDLLNELCVHFVSSIPFDTLDNFGGKKRDFHLTVLYDKIVHERRGENCIGLNAILYWMLHELGYSVEICFGCAYDTGKQCFEDDRHHIVVLVTLDSGQTWVADVGTGGRSSLLPL